MNKTLLLVFFWAVSTTLSFGQSGTNLNRATRFAVLASTEVTNTGTTTVTGDLGISPGTREVPEDNIVDSGSLTIYGSQDLSNASAANAMLDAQASYNALQASSNPRALTSPIGSFRTITPGVYRISGDAELNGLLPLDAGGNSNATFVFIIDGNFTSSANASILLLGGAQSQNIFWVVAGTTVLGNSTVFQGTILGVEDVTLNSNVGLIGRVISLEGAVNFNSNNVIQPIQFASDLEIEKTVSEGDYFIGDEVTYTITATNNGPTNAINIVVQENIPDGLELVSATPAKGSYDEATGQWTIASLSNEESTTLTLVFRITQPGEIQNSVTISGEYHDPDNANNNAAVNITAICPALPEVIEIAGNNEICDVTQEITYVATEVEGATYEFTLPAGWVTVSEEGNTITVRPTEDGVSGTIRVTIIDQCENSASAELDVVIVTVPATPTIEGVDLICDITQTYEFTATGVTENVTYEWVAGGSFEIVSGQGTATVEIRATSVAEGTITVRALTVACDIPGEGTTRTIQVSQPPVAPTAINGNAAACLNTEATYSVEAVEGETYNWTVTGDLQLVDPADNDEEVVVLVNGAGTLSVTATNSCGTTTETTLEINPTAIPDAPAEIAGNAAACLNDEIVYSVAEVTGATGYVWTETGDIEIVGDRTGREVTVRVNGAGTLSAAVTNVCGTGDATTLEINPTTKPDAPAEITGNAIACPGEEVIYSIPAIADATGYIWNVTGDLEILTLDTEREVRVRVNGEGTLSAAVTNVCGTGDPLVLNITTEARTEAPGEITSSITEEICQGQEVTFSIAAVEGAEAYSWTLPEGWTAVTDPANTTELIAIAGASGTVSVRALNVCNEQSEPATVDVTVTPTPAAPAFTSENETPCINTSATYSVEPVAGMTHVWTVTGEHEVGGDGDLEGDDITITLNGPVTISVFAVSGTCSGTATTLEVNPTTEPATPEAITGPAEVCANSSGNVFSIEAVAGATTYNWLLPEGWEITAGEGTTSITVTATNTSGSVIAEASNECFPEPVQSAPLAVGMSTPPAAVTSITDNSTLCEGLSYSIDAVPGATSYTWSIPQGFTITAGEGTTTIRVSRDNNNASGEVTVVPVNAVGCPGPATSLAINTAVLSGDLDFPKAFSPNNDGNNDTWVITNLEKFPANEVVIFNRYGSEVYQKKNYQNNWDGNGLAEGTYFYKAKVTLCDGVTQEFTGYTTIFR